MQDFTFEVTIPKNTLADDPYTQVLPLVKGVISNVLIGFPPGCARMVNIQLLVYDRVVMPANAEMSYAYDAYIFDRDCAIEINDDPYEITVKGWSPNSRYDHKITLAFQIDDEFGLKNRLLKMLFG